MEISQKHIFKFLFKLIELHDANLANHSLQVALYSRQIAREMGFGLESQSRVYLAGLLHDIGKIGMKEILAKPGKLNDQEWLKVKEHPKLGCDVLSVVPGAGAVGKMVLFHHERYDGKGYPAGLKGEEIPVESRILAVADAFEAMTGIRPYRSSLSLDEAVAELYSCSKSQFDPLVVEVFCAFLKRRKMPR